MKLRCNQQKVKEIPRSPLYKKKKKEIFYISLLLPMTWKTDIKAGAPAAILSPEVEETS